MTLAYLDTAIALIVVLLTVSLLITILTQITSGLLAWRGTSLRWALIQLVRTIEPDAAQHTEDIIDKVLRHPLVSDSVFARFGHARGLTGRWARATAIRLEEFAGVLDLMSSVPEPGNLGPNAKEAWESWRTAIRTIADSAKAKVGPQVTAVAEQASELVKEFDNLPPRADLRIGDLLNRVPATAETMLGADIKSWFHATMDRASQRFRMRTRAVTVLFSIVVAFALHLDTLTLLNQFSSQPELRAGLVGVSAAVERVGAELIRSRAVEPPAASTTSASAPLASAGGTSSPAPQNAVLVTRWRVPALYAEAMADVRNYDLTGAGTDASEQQNRERLWKGLGETTVFRSREAATQWIRRNVPAERVERLSAAFESRVNTMLKDVPETDRLLDQSASLVAMMEASRFNLVPRPYHSLDFVPFLRGFDGRHLLGMLITAALLSLGAPFWYNALKTASALKPIVASKAAQEQETSPRA